MVAGYCWDWVSKNQPELKDIVIGDYQATWNLGSDGQGWIIKPKSVSEVGCIHTSQGLELDYVGVIVGPDLVARNGRIVTRPEMRSRMDKSVQGWRRLMKDDPQETAERLGRIIKNTYRTLMTRGQKACFVYFVDDETREYCESRMGPAATETVPFSNALPLLNLSALADASPTEWRRVSGGPFPNDRFLVRVEGDSMEPLIKDGQLCVFRKDPGGSHNGKVVLCRIGGLAGHDPITVVKRYRSARTATSEGIGEGTAIVLSSINEKLDDIVLRQGDDVSIIGLFERVVEGKN